MQTNELQNKIVEFIHQWEKKRNVIYDEQVVFNHVVEEIGELAREYVNKFERINNFQDEKLDNAIMDTLMQLVYLAHIRNLDIEKEILEVVANDRPNKN